MTPLKQSNHGIDACCTKGGEFAVVLQVEISVWHKAAYILHVTVWSLYSEMSPQ